MHMLAEGTGRFGINLSIFPINQINDEVKFQVAVL